MARMMKPRATEFEGIVYRSKSEAMFGCWCMYQCFPFSYEPDVPAGAWKPDFRVIETDGYETRIIHIEYKPSRPTGTYIDECVNAIGHGTEWHSLYDHFRCRPLAAILWGGFFDTPRGALELVAPGTPAAPSQSSVVNRWITGTDRECEQYVRSYRYDLRHGHTQPPPLVSASVWEDYQG